MVLFCVEFVSADGQCCHWGIADHDAGWMDVFIEFGVDTESGADGGADQVEGGWLVAGRARSWQMRPKNRCLMLFYLLIPGGRCEAVGSGPGSEARAASWVCQARRSR